VRYYVHCAGFEIPTTSAGSQTKVVSLADYVEYMEKKGTWGDRVMTSAATLLYGREVIVLSAEIQRPVQGFGNSKLANPQTHNGDHEGDRKPNILLGMMAFGATQLQIKTNMSKTLNHFVSLEPVASHSQPTQNVSFQVMDGSSDSVMSSAVSASSAS
jgi:hypothetical protein